MIPLLRWTSQNLRRRFCDVILVVKQLTLLGVSCLMSSSKPATSAVHAFLDLARTRIVVMEMVACSIAFILAYHDSFPLVRFVWTLLVTGLVTAGACALNCYIERDYDALMERTCQRPLPAGIISPAQALVFGVSLVALGSVLAFVQIGTLCGTLCLALVFLYLAIYTPAKRLTWLNTSIGAVPGAVPPLIGWAAARGEIDLGGWIFFALLFVWQHTHFFPIAWLYKDDYARAGFRMLPLLDNNGKKTFLLTVLSAIGLLPISFFLYREDFTGLYCFTASTLGAIILIAAGVRLFRNPSRASALAVLALSLFYLPVILAAVILDRCGAQVAGQLLVWLEIVGRWT